MKKKILITGGNGKYATELIRLASEFEIYAPNREDADIRDFMKFHQQVIKFNPDYIIHAAAFTKPMQAHETEPAKSIYNNIIGTANVALSSIQANTKLIYISTDYVYEGDFGPYKETEALLPINNYGWSKLGGECSVTIIPNSLILRMAMNENPFLHPKALVDCKKSLITIQEAAAITLKLLDEVGIINVGGEARSVYEFAKETNPEVEKLYMKDINVKLPKDSSMNVDKLKNILKKLDK
jgi:dTDP-4-dehydrorhamnose reductase